MDEHNSRSVLAYVTQSDNVQCHINHGPGGHEVPHTMERADNAKKFDDGAYFGVNIAMPFPHGHGALNALSATSTLPASKTDIENNGGLPSKITNDEADVVSLSSVPYNTIYYFSVEWEDRRTGKGMGHELQTGVIELSFDISGYNHNGKGGTIWLPVMPDYGDYNVITMNRRAPASFSFGYMPGQK